MCPLQRPLPVVYSQAAVCDRAVHGKLPCALSDALLHHITIASHVSNLHITKYTEVLID